MITDKLLQIMQGQTKKVDIASSVLNVGDDTSEITTYSFEIAEGKNESRNLAQTYSKFFQITVLYTPIGVNRTKV